MICNNCKRNINDDERICPHCGQIVRYDDSNFEFSIAMKLRNEFLDYQKKIKEIYETCSDIEKKYEYYFLSFLDSRETEHEYFYEAIKKTKFGKKIKKSLYRSILYDSTEEWADKLDISFYNSFLEFKKNLVYSTNKSRWHSKIDDFVNTSYIAIQAVPVREKIEDYLKKFYFEGYEEVLDDVLSVSSKLKWTFTFGAKKEKILKSYKILVDFMNYEFLTELDNVILEFNNIDFEKQIDVLNELKHNPIDLYNHLYKINDLVFCKEKFGYKIPDYKFYEEKYKSINGSYYDDEYFFNEDINEGLTYDIQCEVEKIVKNYVLSELDKIPIEQINKISRDGKIRVSALKSFNIDTLGDLAYILHSDLMRINGIGPCSRADIRYVIDDLTKSIGDEVKIKLNLDNKNIYYEKIVLFINKYIQQQSLNERIETFENKYIKKLESALLDLEIVQNEYWVFSLDFNYKKIDVAKETLETMLPSYLKEKQELITEFKRIDGITVEDSWEEFKRNPILFNGILEKIVPERFGTPEKQIDLPEELVKEIEKERTPLDGLKCQLRSYQEWGVKYTLHQKKVLIGDEMGLGKTIQAIATMTVLHNRGYNHFLVICPASVLSNWCREVHKFSDLKVVRIHGADKETYLNHWIKFGGVGVTTYETTKFFDLKKPFDFLVVDEAHFIKNPNAQRSRNVKRLSTHTDRIMFLTGTALENRIEEMIELIRYLRPDIAGKLPEISHIGEARKFKETISPVYFRRKREDVLQELPDLIENNDWCTMTSYEEKAYENAILERNFMKSRRVSWNFDDLKYSSKCKRLLEIIDEAKEENRKIIVFSYFLKTIEKIKKVIGSQCFGPINGSVSPKKRQEVIDLFESSSDGSVLLAQIEAAGTGLNIQAASVVVICEPQFKPSIENQAIARAYRMGQTRNVLVHRLLCEDSVDEKITEVLNKKQELFDKYADESVAAKETSDKKLMTNILEEEFNRIANKNKISL